MAYDGYTSIDIFCDNYPDQSFFSENTINKFYNLGACKTLPKERIIYRIGDHPDDCYFIERGLVKSFEYDRKGNEYIYDLYAGGAILFGMGLFLNNNQLPLNFKTLFPTKVVCVPYPLMQAEIKKDPVFAREIFRFISVSYCKSISEIREKSYRSIEWQFCDLILTLAYLFGIEYDGRIMIKESFSQQLLANLLRVSRISVVRTIKKLQNEEQIEKINGYYCIRSMDTMKDYMRTLE